MPAIEGVNRQQIENEQSKIDRGDRDQKVREVRLCDRQPGSLCKHNCQHGDRNQDHVDQWSGGDTPQQGAGPRRRLHVGHAAQRPEHDPIGLPAHLPASEGMAELMQKHNAKDREILDDVPRLGLIFIDAGSDLNVRDQEPAPVQVDLDAGKAKQSEGTGRERVH